MEKKPYLHEVIRPAKEIGELVMGWAKDVICPPGAVDLPRGGGPLLDEYISGPRSVPPANPSLFERRNRAE